MQIFSNTTDEYIDQIPQERKVAMAKLRDIFRKNLPDGFEERMTYGMIGWVVPHSLYPPGYHCTPELPLPFVSIASQKNFIAVYHMCVYSDKNLHDWFVSEYPKHAKTKLDMGKSCIRFKKIEDIPYDLITELAKKVTPQEWIEQYEKVIKR